MKVFCKIIILLFVLGITSCRDTKKEEAEEEAMIEMIDSMEQEASSLSEQVEADAMELEQALKELDSI